MPGVLRSRSIKNLDLSLGSFAEAESQCIPGVKKALFKEWLPITDSTKISEHLPKALYPIDFTSFFKVSDKDFLFREYVIAGKSARQIAREQGCASSTVSNYIYEFGFPPRATGLSYQRKGQIPYGSRMMKGRLVDHKGEQAVIEKLAELRNQGRSFRDLVAWLDINQIETKTRHARWDRPTVYKILKRENLKNLDLHTC